MADQLRIVKLLIDGSVSSVWGVEELGAPARLLEGESLELKEYESEGIELHSNDVLQAKELADCWNVAAPQPAEYFPKDGIAFLITLWATYNRGSRMWAEYL